MKIRRGGTFLVGFWIRGLSRLGGSEGEHETVSSQRAEKRGRSSCSVFNIRSMINDHLVRSYQLPAQTKSQIAKYRSLFTFLLSPSKVGSPRSPYFVLPPCPGRAGPGSRARPGSVPGRLRFKFNLFVFKRTTTILPGVGGSEGGVSSPDGGWRTTTGKSGL